MNDPITTVADVVASAAYRYRNWCTTKDILMTLEEAVGWHDVDTQDGSPDPEFVAGQIHMLAHDAEMHIEDLSRLIDVVMENSSPEGRQEFLESVAGRLGFSYAASEV